MSGPLVWISGGSGGIGAALVATVPWPDARVISISRRRPPDVEHLAADLSDPASWRVVAESFLSELREFDGEAAVFIHAAATLEPIGFAAEVDPDAYASNVVLNSAVPQVLGQAFLVAARHCRARRHLVMLTSGAARTVYPGWSSYGAGKAAVDQWVRTAGAEEAERDGTHVMAVAPGTVATAMQALLRAASEHAFPKRQKFVDLYDAGQLAHPPAAARAIWSLLDRELPNGAVVDVRALAAQPGG